MSNPYTGSKITGCNSPALGNDRSTYSTVLDVQASALDNHDHSTGKGAQIPTGGILDLAITAAKMALASVGTAQMALASVTQSILGLLSVGTPQMIDASVTLAKTANTNRVDGTIVTTYTSGSNPSDVDVPDLVVSFTPLVSGSKTRIRLGNVSSASDPSFMFGTDVILSIVKDGAAAIGALKFTGEIPPSTLVFEDYAPTLGAHTYQLRIVSATGTVTLDGLRLIAEEIR